MLSAGSERLQNKVKFEVAFENFLTIMKTVDHSSWQLLVWCISRNMRVHVANRPMSGGIAR